MVNGDGTSISGRMTFSRSIPPGGGDNTCVETLFGLSVPDPIVNGRVTMTSISSIAGTSSSGNLRFDSDFNFTVRHPMRTVSVLGPQSPSSCTWTFTQATQILAINCRTIAVSGGGSASLAASFSVVSGRFTVS